MKPLGKKAQVGWLLSTLLLVGCAMRPHPEHVPPHDLLAVRLDQVRVPAQAAELALVLGGGGLRGFAHLGVLQALDEAGIHPDLVVGTSAGAVVGAAYAGGLRPAQLLATARELRVASLIDFSPGGGGLMRGRHIAAWVDELVAHQPIQQLAIRYAAVATDLHSGEPVLLAHGPVGAAVQASAAVPGVTAPVALADGTQLIDGGLSSLVPVRAARALGAKAVIAVDIYCHSPRAGGPGALAIAGRALQGQNCRLAVPEMAEADVLIAPSVRVASLSDRDEQAAAVQAGYVAAQAALPRIRALLLLNNAVVSGGTAGAAAPAARAKPATLLRRRWRSIE
jgi:NTE family protein